jgi:putative protein-disulfide isomerase
MRKPIHYLFDPLCGWCYAVAKVVQQLTSAAELDVRILPTGLFSGTGARPMDDSLASYAWSNDQRIAQLTGQVFSIRYRQLVLGDRGQRFDSGAATLALTAVAQTSPEHEPKALAAIQHARYVDGSDVTDSLLLSALLSSIDLDAAARLLVDAPETLLLAAEERVARARALMTRFGLQGIPAFIVGAGQDAAVIPTDTILSDPEAFFHRLTTP